jgi:tetratricopeptide (TPR) repeat protein
MENQGNRQNAIRDYNRQIELYPHLPHGYTAVAESYHLLTMTRNSEDILMKACLTQFQYLRNHHWRKRYALAGFPELKSLYEILKKKRDQSSFAVEPRAGLAYLYSLAGQYPQALNELRSALSQNPDEIPILYLYAEILHHEEGKYKTALEFARKAWKNNRKNPHILLVLAKNHLALGEYDRARIHLEDITDNPRDLNSEEPFYYLGVAHEKLGELEEARKQWLRALEISPTAILPKRALYDAGF